MRRETNAQPAVLACVRATTPMGRQWTVACVAQDLLAFFFCRTCLKGIRLQQPIEPEVQRGLTCLFCIDQRVALRGWASQSQLQLQSPSRLFSGAACGGRTAVADGPLVFAQKQMAPEDCTDRRD